MKKTECIEQICIILSIVYYILRRHPMMPREVVQMIASRKFIRRNPHPRHEPGARLQTVSRSRLPEFAPVCRADRDRLPLPFAQWILGRIPLLASSFNKWFAVSISGALV